MKTGIQLWTVRDEYSKDPINTLKKISKIGYSGVEFAHNYGDPAETKKILDDLGLICIASHIDLIDDVEKQCEDLKTLGTDKWIVNFQWNKTPQSFMDTLKKYKEFSDITAKYNINLFMHNHVWELSAKPFGTPFFEKVLEDVPNLHLEFDMGWVVLADYSPKERIEKYKDRIELLHLRDFIIKDYVSWNGGEALFTKHLTEKILGEGELDVVGCINSSNAEWGILEIDDYNGSMWEAIEKSYKFLKNLIL